MERSLPQRPYAPLPDIQQDVVGPYSQWPRRNRMQSKKIIGISAAALATGTFVHCALPFIF